MSMSPRPSDAPPTPTLDRIQEVLKQSQAIGEFLDWLANTQGLFICAWYDRDGYNGEFDVITDTTNDLLYQYFDIDARVAAQERKALLAWIREL